MLFKKFLQLFLTLNPSLEIKITISLIDINLFSINKDFGELEL
jgi:hypothetical protein